MNHRTKWLSFQNETWRCDGCTVQCQTFGKKPNNMVVCNGSIEDIKTAIKSRGNVDCATTQRISEV